MSYATLSDEQQIRLAAECVGRGVPIPQEIREILGDEIIQIIENPGATHDREQDKPGPQGTDPTNKSGAIGPST